MFLVVIPVIVPFYRASGLDMREVYLLQSVFAVGTLLLEVPTGYAADLLGRKKTLVAGSLFYGVSFTWLAVASGFRGFVLFELLAAVGVALFSGTDAARLLFAAVGPLFGHAMDRLGPANALRLAGWVSLAIALGASLPLVREARALRAV
jgi:MFS family permease